MKTRTNTWSTAANRWFWHWHDFQLSNGISSRIAMFSIKKSSGFSDGFHLIFLWILCRVRCVNVKIRIVVTILHSKPMLCDHFLTQQHVSRIRFRSYSSRFLNLKQMHTHKHFENTFTPIHPYFKRKKLVSVFTQLVTVPPVSILISLSPESCGPKHKYSTKKISLIERNDFFRA